MPDTSGPSPMAAAKFRDRRIIEALPLVQLIAERIAVSLPHPVDRAELETAGTAGLVQAAHEYQGDRDIDFTFYARHRIRAAMLENLRQPRPTARALYRATVVQSAFAWAAGGQ